MECQENYDTVAHEASQEFQKVIDPVVPEYALQKIKMQKLRQKVIDKNKTR